MSVPDVPVQHEDKTVLAARAAISNQRRGFRALLPFLGPAFIAAVAYIDPGNYATNIQSGSEFGYKLLWVVVLANLMAMLIQNMSSKYMAASVFHAHGQTQVADIPSAYKTLTPLLGSAAAGVFLVSLLSSGLSSSAVATMAGQVIMQGFVGFTIPLWLRRVLTMLPTVIIVALGINPTNTLVISQVVLSLVLPMPIIALIHFTRKPELMGILTNRRTVTYLAIACAVIIVALNLLLIYQTLGGPI